MPSVYDQYDMSVPQTRNNAHREKTPRIMDGHTDTESLHDQQPSGRATISHSSGTKRSKLMHSTAQHAPPSSFVLRMFIII
eukprot:jgi/Psemu1/301345/fgenesh1_kg.31_\